MPFTDRRDAGKRLAEALRAYQGKPVVVFALPRGGVSVALEVAKALCAPLELALVRKVGLPFYPEMAMGAVIDGETPSIVRNEDVIAGHGISERDFQACCQRELREIERRRRLYLADRPDRDVKGKIVIIVDDGLATGATMRAAIKGLRLRQPDKIVVAVPVSSADILPGLRREADDVICLETPVDLRAVGLHYGHFPQLTDEDVLEALAEADCICGKEAGERAFQPRPE